MNILGLLELPDILVVLAVILTAFYFYLTKDHGFFKAMGVPGPKPLPWFGNKALYEMPVNERYRELREKYGKVYGTFAGTFRQLVIADVDLVREIMVKEFSTFRNRMLSPIGIAQVPPISDFLFSTRDEYWRRIRTIFTPTFTSGKLKKMVDAMNATSKTLVSCMKSSADKKAEIVPRDFTWPFAMDTIASVSFGVDLDCQRNQDDKFVKNIQHVLDVVLEAETAKKFLPIVWIVVLFPFLAPLVHKLTRFLGWKNSLSSDEPIRFLEKSVHETIALRQTMNKKFGDFLQLMQDAKIPSSNEDGTDYRAVSGDSSEKSLRKLSCDEIVAQALQFIIAGNETTATGLMFAFYCLAVYPEVQDKVVAEIKEHIAQGSDPVYEDVKKCQYLEWFLMETLRIYPVVIQINRLASCDTRVGSYFIPKDTVVLFGIYQIHHDPEIWENPEMFEPERFHPDQRAKHHPAQWIPFGLGPRVCVGQRLALLEMKIALVHVLRQYTISKSEHTEIPLKLGTNDVLLSAVENPIHVRVENRET